MNNRQEVDLATLHRVQGCLDTFAGELAPIDLTYLRGKLEESVGRLEMAVADQAESQEGARSNARHVNELREYLLRHHLEPVVEFARANVSAIGEMQSWKMPADDATEIQVVAVATAAANAATNCKTRFVELGLPSGFIEELQEATAEYSRAIRAREMSRMIRYGSKLTMKYELPVAWEIVRLMGVLIKREFGGRRDLIEAWQQARLHAPRQQAPRLRAPDEVKLLPAATGPALIGTMSAGGVADAVAVEAPVAIVVAPEQQAPPAGQERPGLLRRVFRFLGSAA